MKAGLELPVYLQCITIVHVRPYFLTYSWRHSLMSLVLWNLGCNCRYQAKACKTLNPCLGCLSGLEGFEGSSGRGTVPHHPQRRAFLSTLQTERDHWGKPKGRASPTHGSHVLMYMTCSSPRQGSSYVSSVDWTWTKAKSRCNPPPLPTAPIS